MKYIEEEIIKELLAFVQVVEDIITRIERIKRNCSTVNGQVNSMKENIAIVRKLRNE